MTQKMTQKIDYTQACRNFDKIYHEVISTRQPIEITREDCESISLIPTAELDSLMETVYLFSSHENAVRLLDALQRAKARTNQPQTLENLRQELGIDEEEKVS
jgi:antitoxin YefM